MTLPRAVRLFLAALLSTAPAILTPAAAAAPLPRLGEFTHTLTFEVVRVAPLVSGPQDHLVTVVARATNTGTDPIDGLAYRFQRGERLGSTAKLAAELTEPSQPVTVINSPFKDMPVTFEPGEAKTVVFSVPIAGDEATTLAVHRAGVYPVMVNVNGTVQTPDGPLRARIGELHLTVSIGAIPDSPPAAEQPAAVQVLWPLASTPHMTVGGIFRTDALAGEIAPGGRLDLLLTEWGEASPELVTAVIDPMLLDELDQMAEGYQVLAKPYPEPASLLPETAEPGPPVTGSSGGTPPVATPGVDPAESAPTVPGTGEVAARHFLTRLRALAAERDVIVLPYGDADVAALARAGMTDGIVAAVNRGRGIAEAVLGDGAHLVTDIAVPPGGRITEAAWAELTALGYTGLILDDSGLKPQTAGSAIVTIHGGGESWPVLASGAPHSTEIAQILDTGTGPASPAEIHQLGAEWLINPATADIVITPPRDLEPSPGALAALSRLTHELAEVDLITTRPVTDLLASASTGRTRTLRYPSTSRALELPTGYLHRVADLSADLARLADALEPGTADPADILWPMTEALAPAASASLRGNLGPINGVLATGELTVAAVIDGVSIQPDVSRYTLASTSAPLLLTLRNTLPYRVTATVDLEHASQLGLIVDPPDPVTIEPGPRTADIKIDTTVTRSGTFTVDAQLYIAGQPWGPAVPLTVDSRAYGTLTIVLMASAAGILALMVIWRLVQRIRGRVGVPEDAVLKDSAADGAGEAT